MFHPLNLRCYFWEVQFLFFNTAISLFIVIRCIITCSVLSCDSFYIVSCGQFNSILVLYNSWYFSESDCRFSPYTTISQLPFIYPWFLAVKLFFWSVMFHVFNPRCSYENFDFSRSLFLLCLNTAISLFIVIRFIATCSVPSYDSFHSFFWSIQFNIGAYQFLIGSYIRYMNYILFENMISCNLSKMIISIQKS